MASLNRVFIIGNLTRDPEVRYVPSGTAVSDLRLATSRKYRTASGEEREETCYVDVVVWGRQAETCGEYLKKGSPLLVEGRLQYDEWEKEGQRHSRLRIVADRTQFMPSGSARRSDEVQDVAVSESPAGSKSGGQDEGPSPDIGPGEDGDNLPF